MSHTAFLVALGVVALLDIAAFVYIWLTAPKPKT